MAKVKYKGLMVKTGMGIGVLLFLLIPLMASAVDYTSLATIKRGLTYPTDMAVSSVDGTVYVVDGLSNRVLTYDATYRYNGSISAVESPLAVAVSPTGTVYIADKKTKSVKIIDPSSGQITGSLMKNGTAATFKLPRNIAVGPDNVVYVVDQLADSIEVFAASGSYSSSIAGLAKPQDAVASATELFIIDQPLIQDGTTVEDTINGSRIRVYDLGGGNFITDHAFPSFGNITDNGEYISLKGIGIDSQGYIYVSDSFMQVVYKYSPAMTIDNDDGTTTDIVLGTFLGPLNDGYATPLGMTVSADGRLFVTSSFDGIVKVLGVDTVAGIGTWMNEAPVANAGADQAVDEGTTFVLDGSGSSDSDGLQSYIWTQVSGTPVLGGQSLVSDSSWIDVTAPDVGPEGANLSFQLVVTDAYSKASAVSTTRVAVSNVISGSVVINNGALYTNNQLVTLSLDAPEAVEMRFANDSDPLNGGYYAYTASGTWTLSAYDPSIEANDKTVNVEFKDAGGNITVVSSSILLDMQAPAVPSIDAGGSAGEFNWTPVDGAASYTLQYASNSDFTGAVTLTDLDYNGLTIALDGLAVGTWYWHVRSIDEAGNASAWSDAGSFAVAPDCSGAPNAPQLALPFDNAGDISRIAILETNTMIYPGDCGTHLRTEWQVSQVSDFSTLVMHVGTTLDNLTVYQIPALVLESATTYHWRVRQVASNGKQSDWSDAWAFTTVAAPDEEGVDGVLYVNPDADADSSGEEIRIRETVGDAGVKIKVIRVSSGVTAQTIKELDPDTIPDSVNKPASFPFGLLSFKLTVEPGAFAQVEVSFNGSVPSDADWYIYNVEEGWHAYAGAIFSGNNRSVTLNFQDGGMGDADGVANGIIVNP